MTTVRDVQSALLARGFDVGRAGADNDIGPATLSAMLRALDGLPVIVRQPAPASTPIGVVPAEWMPWGKMLRIIPHWNAGTGKASALDKQHYHLIIEDDGKLVRGDRSIADNVSTSDGTYAAHTLNLNAGSIGVALCGMGGAVQSPFSPGRWPLTRAQWDMLPKVLADLCRRYAINVTPQTVLSHAEVQATLGVKQKGKWDIAILPFDQSLNTPRKVGDAFRAATLALL